MMSLAAAALLLLQAPGDSTTAERFKAIPWQEAGTTARLGSVAEVRVPEGCMFAGKEGTRTFMELTENQSSPQEEGTILCEDTSTEEGGSWFVVFSFDPMGYVKDDERDELDADAMMASLKEGNEAGNEERKKRGWDVLVLEGWDAPPFYDPRTNNLTWATRLRSGDGTAGINHSIRLLGRGGVMNVELVASPDQKPTALPALDSMLTTFAYLPGQRYAEWREGDKVAAVGLTGLVVGGAGALAAKTGFLGKLGKALAAGAKAIIVAVVALGAWLRKFLTRKKDGEGATAA